MKKNIIIAHLYNAFSQAVDITQNCTLVSDEKKMICARFMGYIKMVFVILGDIVK